MWPLPLRNGLLSSFGEWREGHLHAGIDLPTQRIGEEVYSVNDGWVMRAKTSPFGYGKVLYIRSWEGEIYVYAHLSSFFYDLRRKIRSEQLRKGSYEVEIWFKEGQIPVKKGDIIGYSGRSGCYDPHLHFELRDNNNNPVDAFCRGFTVFDNIPPVIKAVRFVPLDEASTVFGSHVGKVFKVTSDTISVSVEGKVGIEIEVVDMVNTRSGKLGPKEIRLYKNGSLLRREFIDKFSYSNYKDSRFLFDFEYRVKTGRKFRRLFTVPGNGFPFYQGGDGIIAGDDTGYYLIEVYDGAGNCSRLVLKLLNLADKERLNLENSGAKKIVFETNGFYVRGKWYDLRKINEFLISGDSIAIWNFTKKQFKTMQSPDGKCQIILGPPARINSKLIAVRVTKGEEITWSWEPPIPLKRKVKIKIKVPDNGKLYSLYEKNRSGWSHCSSEVEDGYLVDFVDHLGVFCILKDTISPMVSLGRKYFSSETPLQINVRDSLSGVDFYSIKTLINDKQTVFRYDPQMERLVFEHPEEISKGAHKLSLFLSDKQGNKVSKMWKIEKK